MAAHTMQDLKLYQALPLDVKVEMTKNRIRGWVREFGENGVYVSFSGGKDSTVLLHIVREEYPNIPAVFVDVPTQYPELREFAKTWDNVEIIKPKMSFMQVCDKYGFPIFSKENSDAIYGARKYMNELDRLERLRQKPNRQTDRLRMLITTEQSEALENMPIRMALLMGMLTKDNKKMANIPNKDRSLYSKTRYEFMLDAPFDVSSKCCNLMKKNPAHKYQKETGKMPIIATMASESRLRTQKWLQDGCNAFDNKTPTSTPMAFWTEQDVLQYVKQHNLPICSVYGDIVEDWDATEDIEGQMTISDLEGWEDSKSFDAERPKLKTTGCDRTGCVLCGFGCHLEKPGEGRFERLKETHPGFYKLLDVVQNNGVTYREAIEWINEHGNMNIKL